MFFDNKLQFAGARGRRNQKGHSKLTLDEFIFEFFALEPGSHDLLDELAMLEVDLRQAALELQDLPGQLMIRLAQRVELGRVCSLGGAQRGPLLGELVLCARTHRVSY